MVGQMMQPSQINCVGIGGRVLEDACTYAALDVQYGAVCLYSAAAMVGTCSAWESGCADALSLQLWHCYV
jgi:hypothetical protein